MAFYRSLRKLAETNPLKKSRPFFTSAAVSGGTVSPIAPSFSPLIPQFTNRLSPLSKWFVPLHGPLFLSSPPWKLLQSATPLHWRGNGAVLRKVEALSVRLDRIRRRTRLGLQSVTQHVDDNLAKEEGGSIGGGILESFVNVPNMISMARLASGPVLWWMILNEMYTPAFVGLAVSGASDWVNTVFQLALVAGALLQPEFGNPDTQTWINYLSWLVASTTMASTAAYGAQYMKNKPISMIKRS
ncbi:hypothetical protein F2Q68_00020521 [Brassica cretica]|uniref:Uncharacterized protein n=1 Tax=Brassica cretica TaxID=69181 RepID=A0A8S9G112_BRACR|nr:hypothetical protein F2Q68_00020521 [Brassica cretica]